LPLSNWHLEGSQSDLPTSLGLKPFVPLVPPVVGEVLDDSPAKAGGLQKNDRIVAMDGKPLKDWLDLVTYVKEHPGKTLSLEIKRDGQRLTQTLVIGSKTIENKTEGFLGVRSQEIHWPEKWLRYQRLGPLDALASAGRQTVELSAATLTLIGRFITGKLGLENLGGPVGIAVGAGQSARGGLASYLSFLALISISLGVLNLLPIPMLDGGHLLFYLLEWIRRKPVSIATKSIALYAGLLFLLVIMALALNNDIVRLMG
jgi:regulator of sigma E protease